MVILILLVVAVFLKSYIFQRQGKSHCSLQSKLSKIVSSADTTMGDIQISYQDRISFYVNDIKVGKQLIDRFYYYKRRPDHKLMEKHLKYVKASKSYKYNSEHDKITRATMGAALESLIAENVENKPNICLIHHTISYLYAQGYKNLLLNIIDNLVQQEEYMAVAQSLPYYYNDRTSTVMTVRILPHLLSINIELDDLAKKKSMNEEYDYAVYSNIEFFILPTKYNSKILQYCSVEGLMSIITNFMGCPRGIHNVVQCSMPIFIVKERKLSKRQVSDSMLPVLDVVGRTNVQYLGMTGNNLSVM
ncbi:hypothetical protein EDL79_01305 [Ehrlichia ruminantium]|uniref:Uncharacterized protein n=2 Tax=Ehrlichia ruminantium TaxID=779 RepID=A0AAE6UID6_EHRRU|nr:hypothetical protein [Ehrlichia ruminantium]QGR02317.1 hypothetical protein EDL81_01305 [Ehrlichia ruminantium]QGR03237.1 hypothetical protein EDL80_01305 [Ehrlichia ruminantium]QGR04162.1 hypothetical protein EDL79_01305 [Ehrlichia ruminantium]